MLQRWGMLLQVVRGTILQMVDAIAGGGALCLRGGASCCKWWIRTLEVGHYASEVGFVYRIMKAEQIQDSGEMTLVELLLKVTR